MYKLQDGGIIKLLPILRKSGDLSFSITADAVYLENKFIFDFTGKNYLRRMTWSSKNNPNGSSIPLATKHFLSAYVNGEIKFINVGKSIMDIISDVNFDVRSDDHLHLKIRMVNTPGGQFPDYKSSCIVSKKWDKPVMDINDMNEWSRWIKSNQPGYIEDFLERQSMYNHIDILKKAYGENLLSEIVSDDRNKKIETILN
jgi:hypothetical protein